MLCFNAGGYLGRDKGWKTNIYTQMLTFLPFSPLFSPSMFWCSPFSFFQHSLYHLVQFKDSLSSVLTLSDMQAHCPLLLITSFQLTLWDPDPGTPACQEPSGLRARAGAEQSATSASIPGKLRSAGGFSFIGYLCPGFTRAELSVAHHKLWARQVVRALEKNENGCF